KHLLGILKAEAVLSDVRPVLRLVPFVFHSISSIVLLFVVTSKLSRKLVVAKQLIDSITDQFSCLPAIPTWGVLATTILVWARAVFPLMTPVFLGKAVRLIGTSFPWER